MTEYVISVVVAIYNIEHLIKRCIDSILEQSYKKIEIILVNDASTDNSLNLCLEYANKDSRIKVIDKKINEGLSMARNSGLEEATGDYVVFVDGDDFIEHDAYQILNNYLNSGKYDMVIFESNFLNRKGKKSLMPIVSEQDVYTGNQIMPEIIGTFPNDSSDYAIGYTPWGKVYSRRFLKKNNLKFKSEREILYEDLFFALDCFPLASRIGILHKPLYVYCENQDSLTRKYTSSKFNRLKKMYYYLKNDCNYNSILFTNKQILIRFKRTILSYIRLCVMQAAGKHGNIEDVKKICTDDFTLEVLDKYPYKLLPLKQRIFTRLMLNRRYFLLVCVVKLNNLI